MERLLGFRVEELVAEILLEDCCLAGCCLVTDCATRVFFETDAPTCSSSSFATIVFTRGEAADLTLRDDDLDDLEGDVLKIRFISASEKSDCDSSESEESAALSLSLDLFAALFSLNLFSFSSFLLAEVGEPMKLSRDKRSRDIGC